MTNKFFFLSVFFLIIIKILAIYLTEFNLFADEAQYWLWAQSLDFGYYSKPPLLAWCLRVYTEFFGNGFESLKVFSLITYTLTALIFFAFCRKLELSRGDSVGCALFFCVMPGLSFSSFLISTDVILLLFWLISMFFLLEIRQNPKKSNFVFLGMSLGFAFLAKYAAVYFLLCLAVYLFFDKKIRSAFINNLFGVFLFFLIMLIIMLPNIIWNNLNGWVTFFHTASNANLTNYNINLFRGLIFILIQIAMIGPIIFIGFLVNINGFKTDFQNRILISFSAPIILIVFIESVLVRANANWAAPALISVFLMCFRSIILYKPFILSFNFLVNFGVGVFLFIAIAFSLPITIFDRINGIDSFALSVKNLSKNNNIVVSDRMIFSNLAYELRDSSVVLYMTHKPNKPITNHFQLKSKLKKNENFDFILIGSPNDISYLSNKYVVRFIREFNLKFTSIPVRLYEVTF